MTKAESLLIKHEGIRYEPYEDTVGKVTIGVGHNISSNPLPTEFATELAKTGALSHDSVMELLDSDIAIATHEVSKFQWFSTLNDDRQAALIDMIFNLGMPRFLEFHNMITDLEKGDFEGAAVEMLASHWADQVGDRAKELAGYISGKTYIPL